MKATQVIASAFMAEVRRSRRKNKRDGIALDTGVFTISIADIEKALKPHQRSDPMTKLPVQYHQRLKVSDYFLAEKLPPHRKGVDLRIEIAKDMGGNEKAISCWPLCGMG
jgi:hypothetical protein